MGTRRDSLAGGKDRVHHTHKPPVRLQVVPRFTVTLGLCMPPVAARPRLALVVWRTASGGETSSPRTLSAC